MRPFKIWLIKAVAHMDKLLNFQVLTFLLAHSTYIDALRLWRTNPPNLHQLTFLTTNINLYNYVSLPPPFNWLGWFYSSMGRICIWSLECHCWIWVYQVTTVLLGVLWTYHHGPPSPLCQCREDVLPPRKTLEKSRWRWLFFLGP